MPRLRAEASSTTSAKIKPLAALPSLPYDALAQIYDLWISTGGPELHQIREFYAQRYLATQGLTVECGVGNGRILIAAALDGKAVTGVDSSAAMLDLCRRKAQAAGVAEMVCLIQADFRDFQLSEPASLIAMPYDSIGHLVTAAERESFFQHAFAQLAPGGILIFDQAIHDVDNAARHDGQPRLRTTYFDPETGREMMLWYTSHQDVEKRRRRAIVYVTEAGGAALEGMRMIGAVENSWVQDTVEVSAMLQACGFRIQSVLGDFESGPLRDDSEYRIWTAEKPR